MIYTLPEILIAIVALDLQRDQGGVIGASQIAMEIKPTNPTPPVAPARKVERQGGQRRDETPKRRTREDRTGRENDEPVRDGIGADCTALGVLRGTDGRRQAASRFW